MSQTIYISDHSENSAKLGNTHHVSGIENRGKRQTASTPSHTSNFIADVPFPQLRARERVLACPIQRQRPPLISNPIADKIGNSGKDQRFDVMFEQCRYIVMRGVYAIHVGIETVAHAG
jgi:hypothetical protein